jgi:hypothetical protein
MVVGEAVKQEGSPVWLPKRRASKRSQIMVGLQEALETERQGI